MPSIATIPNGMAATRKVFGIFSAGDVMYHSSSAYSKAGTMSDRRKVAITRSAKASMNP